MKYLKTFIILFLILGCQNQNKKPLTNGTWNDCKKDGSYWEYKITSDYFMMITTQFQGVWVFKNKPKNNFIVLSNLDPKTSLLLNNDTLIIISQSKDQIVLKSKNTLNKIELNKVEFDFDPIDSTDLELWKRKVLSDFTARAKSANCPDLRTETEKEITIEMPHYEEIEVQIENY